MQKLKNITKRLSGKAAMALCAWLAGMGAVQAQDNVYVAPGTGVGFYQDTVIVYGKMLVDGGTVVFNPNARVFFYGDTMRITAASSVSGAGQFIFKGPRLVPAVSSFTQYLDAGGNQLASVVIDNNQDVHLTGSAAGALDTLRFLKGYLYLNAHNFTVGNGNPGVIDGYNENQFVITNTDLATNSGFLIRNNVGATNVVFPIGMKPNTYEPGAISNTGTPDLIRMRVAPFVYEFVTSGSQQNDRSTQTTWFVEEGTPGGSVATLQLQHNDWHEGAHFTNYRPFHFISRYVGFSPNTEGDTISYTNWDNFQKTSTQACTTPGFLTTGTPISNAIVSDRANLTYFGAFAKTVWNDPWMVIPLPINFINVKAAWKTADIAKVSWKVNQDIDAKAYRVERILPGEKAFSAVQTVNAQAGAGVFDYAINDNLAGIYGTVIYRVIGISDNGVEEKSEMVSLFKRGGASAGIVMMPNPASSYVDVQAYGDLNDGETLDVKMYNATGALVYQNSDPSGEKIRVNIGNFSEGVYMVQIRRGAIYETKQLMVTNGE